MPRVDKAHILLLVAACLGIFFVNLEAIYINIMEARNFITAREMLMDGNWIFTTINGEPRYQKPPLPTWMTAASAAVFGLKSLFALRLPAALMSLVLVLTFYKLNLGLSRERGFSLLSSLVLATSFYIIFSGRNGQWDIFTHSFMLVAIYQLHRLFSNPDHSWRYAVLGGLAFGASIMSKGPVSLYALWLPFMIAYGFSFGLATAKKRLGQILVFALIALVTGAWWYWYTYTYDQEAFAAITKRETANWTGYNVRPFYYYWSFFTQSGVWTLPAFVALLYPYLRKRVNDNKLYLFSWLWTMASVVLLSVIPEKKSRYLLPVLIPMAMNTAVYLDYLFRHFREITDWKEKFPVYLHFGLIALIGLVFPVGGFIFLGDDLSGKWVWFVLLSVCLFAIGVYLIKALRSKNIRLAFYLVVAFIVAIMCFGLPMAPALTVNEEFKSMAALNDWESETGLKAYEYDSFTPELVWAYGKPMTQLKYDDQLQLPDTSAFGILVHEENQEILETIFKDFDKEFIQRFDMNPKGREDRSHKPRLYRDLYLLSRK